MMVRMVSVGSMKSKLTSCWVTQEREVAIPLGSVPVGNKAMIMLATAKPSRIFKKNLPMTPMSTVGTAIIIKLFDTLPGGRVLIPFCFLSSLESQPRSHFQENCCRISNSASVRLFA